MRNGFIRRRLTYANVLSSLALFVALGGVSYAAATLPRNSVGAAQIRSGAVTPNKLGVALGSNSAMIEGTRTIASESCEGGGSGLAAPPCPGPRAVPVASTTISTKQRANIVVFAMGNVSDPVGTGPDVSVTLGASVDHGDAGGPGSPTSITTVAPREQQAATFVATYPNVPPGRHVVSLSATAGQGSVALSFLQLTAIALPSG